MPNVTNYDGFIFKIVKRYENITRIDPSITLDDLWGEAYEIYTKLLTTPLTCEFITALGRQIEQRYMDIYRVAKRFNSHLDRNKFIEEFATNKSKMSRIHFSELPQHMQDLVRKIYEDPEEIAEVFPKNGVKKEKLVKYLTKQLDWKRKTALAFAETVSRQSKRTVHVKHSTMHI